MKRNLLMLLFAMLIGVFTSKAQDVYITINIDNPAMAAVSVGSPLGDPLDLFDGFNRVPVPENRPLFVRPLNGATLTVTVNQSITLDLLHMGDIAYYNTLITGGMLVTITSEGGVVGPSTIATHITLNNEGSAELITGDEKTDIVSNQVYDLPSDEWAIIAPKDGWTLENCGFGSAFSNDMWTLNSDGTYSFKPVQYGSIYVQTKLKGIDFNVDVNAASNVIVNAFDKDGQDLGELELTKSKAPFLATAPLSATSLSFNPAEGGKILSITRVDANGQRTELPDGNLNEGGWRSVFAEGDTFEIEAIGPEAEVNFKGYAIVPNPDPDAEGTLWSPTALANTFVVTVGGTSVSFEEGAMEESVKAHIGDIVSVTTRRGYVLQSPNGIEGVCLSMIENEGTTQSAYINEEGTILMTALLTNEKVINIDHAEGVKIQGAFGTGDVLELQDGENVLQDVANPLKITANEGWMILSVVLDGETLRPQGNSYTATLENGSVLTITTRETDKPFPVTITAIGGGQLDNLVVTQNGEVVDLSNILSATNFTSITIAAKPGYIIKSVTDAQQNSVSYDPKTNTYNVFFTNAASMITVDFETPAEDEAFVGFDCADKSYCLAIYDENGNFIHDVMGEGLWYVWPGFTAKVKKGYQAQAVTFTGYSCFKTLTVNGIITEFSEEDFVRRSEMIKLDTERTAISATIAYPEFPISISGSQALETEIGTGVVLGTIYINKEGEMSATAWPGETVKVIPVPAKGYIFDKFSYFDGDKEIDYDFDIVGPAEDGSYTFTIPMDYVAESIFMRGFFVPDPENPSYLIQGNNVYANVGTDEDDILLGIVMVNGGSDLFAYPGEKVEIAFYMAEEYDEEYYCDFFCSYNRPDTPLKYEIVNGRCFYTVDPEDVAFSNIISISANVKKKGQGGINGVDADSDFYFDAAAGVLHSATDVKVYNAAGQLVETFTAGENSLENLPAGVYLLSNGVKTLKIAK